MAFVYVHAIIVVAQLKTLVAMALVVSDHVQTATVVADVWVPLTFVYVQARIPIKNIFYGRLFKKEESFLPCGCK